VIKRLQNVMDVLDERLSDGMDHHAERNGWKVERSGRFGLTRTYVRKQCTKTNGAEEPNLAREGRTDVYPGRHQVGDTDVVLAWRELDSASGPRHSTQGE
jgi:hypothetical protein